MGKEKAKEKPQRGSVQVRSTLLSVGYRCVEVMPSMPRATGLWGHSGEMDSLVPQVPTNSRNGSPRTVLQAFALF